MAVYFKSEINRRSSNEDSFCDIEFRINHEAAVHVMSVSDGMGGLTGGRYYSRAAVERLNEKLLKLIMGQEFMGSSLHEQTELLTEFCGRVFQEINQELYTEGLNAGIRGGTTLSVVIRFWHNIIIANCGDSPVYYIKNGQLSLASDIQNAAWEMIQEGKTEEGSLLYYQNKTRLLQYLGRRDPVKPFIRILKDEEADDLLIGTDGAFGNMTHEQIQKLTTKECPQQRLLSELFEAARAGGEEDNQTAIYYCSGLEKTKTYSPKQQEQQDAWPAGTDIRLETKYGTSEYAISREERYVPGDYKKVRSRIDYLKNRIMALKSSGGKEK